MLDYVEMKKKTRAVASDQNVVPISLFLDDQGIKIFMLWVLFMFHIELLIYFEKNLSILSSLFIS